jgi:hypothetical protein
VRKPGPRIPEQPRQAGVPLMINARVRCGSKSAASVGFLETSDASGGCAFPDTAHATAQVFAPTTAMMQNHPRHSPAVVSDLTIRSAPDKVTAIFIVFLPLRTLAQSSRWSDAQRGSGSDDER